MSCGYIIFNVMPWSCFGSAQILADENHRARIPRLPLRRKRVSIAAQRQWLYAAVAMALRHNRIMVKSLFGKCQRQYRLSVVYLIDIKASGDNHYCQRHWPFSFIVSYRQRACL